MDTATVPLTNSVRVELVWVEYLHVKEKGD